MLPYQLSMPDAQHQYQSPVVYMVCRNSTLSACPYNRGSKIFFAAYEASMAYILNSKRVVDEGQTGNQVCKQVQWYCMPHQAYRCE